ncbi:deoxyhypusine synthase [Physcomitrium patens]|uniref:deoxyhypusine synthase n=1 Tax=Physcomitrium patens TaxID=3218 RepID=UPI003CCCDAF8
MATQLRKGACGAAMAEPKLLAEALNAVLRASQLPDDRKSLVVGDDFNNGLDLGALLCSLHSTGFQAAHLGQAITEVNRMLDWRLSDETIDEDNNNDHRDPEYQKGMKCKNFLECTSNLISSGARETISFLIEHKLVDVLVTTAGGVEDLIKCLAPTYMGDFAMKGAQLRSTGLSGIGNLLVPNDNYFKFEDWVVPILDQLLVEQKNEGKLWTSSKVIARLGKEISYPDSICYWAQRRSTTPTYCPALTDGSIGDKIYFHSFHNPGLVIDIIQDIGGMNGEAVYASLSKTGVIILGGGLPKHHICNANLMRNGADFAVFIYTAQEYDGSDSGARPDEAVSWGKIRGNADSIKVNWFYTELHSFIILPQVFSLLLSTSS